MGNFLSLYCSALDAKIRIISHIRVIGPMVHPAKCLVGHVPPCPLSSAFLMTDGELQELVYCVAAINLTKTEVLDSFRRAITRTPTHTAIDGTVGEVTLIHIRRYNVQR